MRSWTRVAPLAGAWIEIYHTCAPVDNCPVAPLAGAWIEIVKSTRFLEMRQVAPLAGAWIEIFKNESCFKYGISRSPCGSVD